MHLHALEVLKNEHKDHSQRQDADYQRCPGAAESGLALARVGSGPLWRLLRPFFRPGWRAHRPDCRPANAKPATTKLPSKPTDHMATEAATRSLALKRLWRNGPKRTSSAESVSPSRGVNSTNEASCECHNNLSKTPGGSSVAGRIAELQLLIDIATASR